MRALIFFLTFITVSSASDYSRQNGGPSPGSFSSGSQDSVEEEAMSHEDLHMTEENRDLIQNIPRDETIQAQEEDALDYSTTPERRFREQDSIE